MGRLAGDLVGVSVKECARQLNISDTAIHKAIKAGRVQRHADKSVTVEDVRRAMAETADPLRGGQRQAGVFGELPFDSPVQPGDSEPVPETKRPAAHAPLLAARTQTEQIRAEREQIELARLKGTVAEIEPMTRAIFDAMVSARSELMALPDRLTPLVTPETDPAKVYGMIELEITRICETLREKLMSKAAQQATVSA